MTTIYLILEVSALLLIIVLPLAGPKKNKNKRTTTVEISDWVVNEDGILTNLSEPDNHPIKIR
jgi:hypothetical protein